jgi:hypothetical protein
MTHGVNFSGASPVQMFQAQQAFRPQPKKARPEPEEQLAPDSYEMFQFEALDEPEPPAASQAASLKQRLPVADIQAVAQRAGYVGLSERAIQQAYLRGDSLLVDTRA